MKYLFEYNEDNKPTISVRHGRKSISNKTMLKESEGRKFVTIREILDETFGMETHFIDRIELTK